METGPWLSLIQQTGEAGDPTCDPWFTKQAVYPLHHGSSKMSESFKSEHKVWVLIFLINCKEHFVTICWAFLKNHI